MEKETQTPQLPQTAVSKSALNKFIDELFLSENIDRIAFEKLKSKINNYKY